MFTRFLEMTIKPEKKTEFLKKIKNEIIPILKSHKGFFDVIHLEAEPAKFYAISLWQDKMEMEKYAKESFPEVNAILEPLLAAPVVVKTCTMDEALTARRFMAAAA